MTEMLLPIAKCRVDGVTFIGGSGASFALCSALRSGCAVDTLIYLLWSALQPYQLQKVLVRGLGGFAPPRGANVIVETPHLDRSKLRSCSQPH